MIDDVRLAVLGRAPVDFVGRLSLDESGFGIAPDLDVAVLRARIEGGAHEMRKVDRRAYRGADRPATD